MNADSIEDGADAMNGRCLHLSPVRGRIVPQEEINENSIRTQLCAGESLDFGFHKLLET